MTPHDVRLNLQLARRFFDGRTASQPALKDLASIARGNGHGPLADLLDRVEAMGPEAHPELRRAFSLGQLESKLWLLDVLRGVLPHDRPYRFTVVGGWLGTLTHLMNSLHPEWIESILQIDIDASANRRADFLNHDLGDRFRTLDIDALAYDYEEGGEVIINTSCEHFQAEEMRYWLKMLPAGKIVVLQSNDLYDEPDHVNCHFSVFQFRKSLDLQSCLYTGTLPLERYQRFMVIGITRGL